MSSKLINNRKITDGVIATPGTNTNLWYTRETNGSFSINGSLNGSEDLFDWVLCKSNNSRLIKAGVVKITSDKKTAQIKFDTSFPDNRYYVFYLQSNNVNCYTIDKKINQFVIQGSWNFGSEISWLAIHKDFARTTGIANPGSIYSGSRTLGTTTPSLSGARVDIQDDDHVNLDTWYENEYIIRPTNFKDGIIIDPNLENYSIIISSNKNINIFWNEKATDRFKIATSFSTPCTIDYLMIKKGIDWWNEF